METNIYVGFACNNQLEEMHIHNETELDEIIVEQLGEQASNYLELPEQDNQRGDGYKNIKRRKMSAVIFGEIKDSIRKDANIINRSVLPLDLDALNPNISTRGELAKKVSSLINARLYIFPSLGCNYHNKGLRYHIWVPLSRAVNKDEYQLLIGYYNRLLKEHEVITQIDRSNRTWSQINGAPYVTQFTPTGDRDPLVLRVDNKILNTDDAIKNANLEVAKTVQPKGQVSVSAAKSILKDSNAIQIVTAFVKNNERWLKTYNNFLASYFAVKSAENNNEINHAEAISCVRALAGSDQALADANENKYEHDHTEYAGRGLSWFIQRAQLAKQYTWLMTSRNGVTTVDIPILAEEIISEHPVRYNSSVIGNGGAIWLNNAWRQSNVEGIIRHLIDSKLKKAGAWNRNLTTPTLRYIEDNNPAVIWKKNYFDEPSSSRLVEFDNGTLDLDTLTLKKNDPQNLIPVHFNYEWNENLKLPSQFCQHWTEMISDLVNHDTQAIETIVRAVGYMYERDYSHQIMLILQGNGANGKSYFMNLIRDYILGEEHVSTVSLSDLANDNNRFSSSQLYHKSLNEFSDISSNFLNSTGKAKNLSGGDAQTAEYKGRTGFSFVNFALLWFTGNELPAFKDDSAGFARRPRVIAFEQDFRKEEIKAHFSKCYPRETLIQEAQAFRQYCISEYHQYRDATDEVCFPESQQMKMLKQNWLNAANSSALFFQEDLYYDADLASNNLGENARYLYQIYNDWALDNGVKPLSRQKFETKLNVAFPKAAKARSRYNKQQAVRWIGIRFTDDGFYDVDHLRFNKFDYNNRSRLIGFTQWKTAGGDDILQSLGL